MPCCGEDYLKTGGDSSCVSAQVSDMLVIFDAGTGLHDLGFWLDENPHITQLHLFLSHVHYDHVIGFPFFKALWRKDLDIHVYSTTLRKQGGCEAFFREVIFADPLFPVTVDMLSCGLSFHDCQDGQRVSLGSETEILIEKLHHPGGASGFRLTHQGKVVSYVCDTEHQEGFDDPHIIQLVEHADLVIYDSTFTDEEYPRYKGWGHSTWQAGMRLCQNYQAKKMAIYHHDPSHTDDEIEKIEQQARQAWSGLFVARQGQIVRL